MNLPLYLTKRAGDRLVTGIGRIGAARPLPDHAEGIAQRVGVGCDLPDLLSVGKSWPAQRANVSAS